MSSKNPRTRSLIVRFLVQLLRKKDLLWWFLCLLVVYHFGLIAKFYDAHTTNNPPFDDFANGTVVTWNKPRKSGFRAPPGTLASCLLVMDDNHFLVEWIAYHYHSAGLRKLVVAIDPKSTTSPLEILGRWKNRIELLVWTSDGDYMDPHEFGLAQQAIARTFRETTPLLAEHRARQRLFYTKCLRRLKQDSLTSEQPAWTMLVDVDEFVRVNYQAAAANETRYGSAPEFGAAVTPISQSGSVASVLEKLAVPRGDSVVGESSAKEEDPPWGYLQSSPCIPLPRIRFVTSEDERSVERRLRKVRKNNTESDSFVTQLHRKHARKADFTRNKISKTILDLGRIPLGDILDVDSIHMPIRKHCSQRNLHRSPKDSLLVINHYLGSYDQFTYRENDSRNEIVNSTDTDKHVGAAAKGTKVNVRNGQHFFDEQKFRYRPETDDEIIPWLDGFLQDQEEAKDLLRGSGRLAPKTWQRPFGAGTGDRCALLFFGLTRSYRDMVLPSLTENVLKPNARHGCDVYVHFYQQAQDIAGRKNDGGNLHSNEIFLLQDAVHSVSEDYYDTFLRKGEYEALLDTKRPEYRPPIVAFTHDTPEEFLERRSEQLQKYHQEMTSIGRAPNDTVKAYFPWAAKSYAKSSLDNIVKQWHSIQSAFKLMEYNSRQRKLSYTRVGMFRSDCLYVTPIDIASLGSSSYSSISRENIKPDPTIPRYDVNNQYVVTPSFALYPVNDRLIYGPYEAVKIWATKRFDLVEESARLQNNPGYTMHSERFLNTTIFPAIEALGYQHAMNGEICFLRTRVGTSAFMNDCNTYGLIPTPPTIAWNEPPEDSTDQIRLTRVQDIVGKNCTLVKHGRTGTWTSAVCT